MVQDIFMTPTAQLADVVLPAAAWAEKEGTYTSTERRVQWSAKAIEPPGSARCDLDIICEIARRLGVQFNYPGCGIGSGGDQSRGAAVRRNYSGAPRQLWPYLALPEFGSSGNAHTSLPGLQVQRGTGYHCACFIQTGGGRRKPGLSPYPDYRSRCCAPQCRVHDPSQPFPAGAGAGSLCRDKHG